MRDVLIKNINRLSKNKLVMVATMIIVLLSVFGFWLQSRKTDNNPEIVNNRFVETETVLNLSRQSNSLPLIGKVVSATEAYLRTEAAGEVVVVNKEIGDSVVAGDILIRLKNNSQLAEVERAEAALLSAKANEKKVKTGARFEQLEISTIKLEQEKKNLINAERSLSDSLASAYTVADNVVRNYTDPLFLNPRNVWAQVNIPVFDQSLRFDIGNGRIEIEYLLDDWLVSLNESSESSSIKIRAEAGLETLAFIQNWLNLISLAVNDLPLDTVLENTTVSIAKTNLATARSAITNAISSLSAANDGLITRENLLSIAQNEYNMVVNGERDEDILLVEAGVKQAEANLAAAQANYERTVVRSPIAGTVNSLSVSQGDYVSNFELVTVVSNNQNLEIISAISEKDVSEIEVGSNVLINNKYKAQVSNIAPAIDPLSGKIEVKININSKAVGESLINGQTVNLAVERKIKEESEIESIMLPLSSIKVEPDRIVVFTIDSFGQLIAQPVKIGRIMGDKVEIISDLPLSLEIVLDARGLNDGQQVDVSNR